MVDKPVVKAGDWISIGNSVGPRNAVVCTVIEDGSLGNIEIEVVYLDGREAVNEHMVWNDDKSLLSKIIHITL